MAATVPNPQKGGPMFEMRGLVKEHWADVYRAARRIGMHGEVTVDSLCGAITHELSLGPRDFPVLMKVLLACCVDGQVPGENAEVSLQKLREHVADVDVVVETDDSWKTRCGLQKPPPRSMKQQRAAASAGARRKYEIENHGSPYAIMGDAMAALRHKQNERDAQEQKFTKRLAEVTVGDHISRKALWDLLFAELDVSYGEVESLFKSIDPHGRGNISIKTLVMYYLPELVKPKSLRRSTYPLLDAARIDELEARESVWREYKDSPRRGASASPRNPNRHPTSAKAKLPPAKNLPSTRSARLRVEAGKTQRDFMDGGDWIMKRSSPRRPSPQSARKASPRTTYMASVQATKFPKVKTDIPRDPAALGNVPVPPPVY